MERIRFLSRSRIDELHDEMIKRHGGLQGILNGSLIDSAIAAPQATFGGQFLYGTIHEMACTLLIGLACNHGYVDGNKRTAAHGVSTFYLMNGYMLDADEDAFVKFITKLVTEKPERREITAFLENSTKPLSEPLS